MRPLPRMCRCALGLLIVTWFVCGTPSPAAPADSSVGIVVLPEGPEPLERFAARELQRYLYLRTGSLWSIDAEAPAAGPRFRLVRAADLGAGNYRLTGRPDGTMPEVTLAGGDGQGMLYAAYRMAELLGVRFYLHGDVVPDMPAPLEVRPWEEEGRALFAVRGLQPFHDFAEGPDWWDADHYLAVLGQMAKLRMNFLGLHTYPESQVGPEPTVWIGLPGDYDEAGQVHTAYPASYHTTRRSGKTWWGYDPVNTSDFGGGAAQLFERDDFGGRVMKGKPYSEQTPADAAEVFNRTGELLGRAFARARELGILTCVGTETPLTLPAPVRQRLEEAGKDPGDPEVIRDVYRAMFDRIRRAYPADYYWLWTPENWTWEGNHPEQFAATAADIEAALAALQDLGQPMTLATCGWVLGPQHDRAALDRLLPLDSPMSAINSAVGHTPIERQFANLRARPKWAIPWLENDGTITAPQLWTGRMRYDAVDARRLGCTGLIGIHWRTGVLAPAIAALAQAAWDQSWVPADFDAAPIPPLAASGATGGRVLRNEAEPGAEDPAATNRIGTMSYDLLVPAGTYDVRLGFSAPDGVAAGERVFAVKLQGEIVAEVDAGAAPEGREIVCRGVTLSEARLLLEFEPRAGEPAIAFIDVSGTTQVGGVPFRRRINCGGPAVDGHEADELPGQPRPAVDRAMPVAEFYQDFAGANFGPEAAADIAAIFTAHEGVNLPLPNHWIDGPGDIKRNREPWSRVRRDYAFVAELEALRPRIVGAAQLDRFDYWLHQFRAMRLLAHVGCLAGALDQEMESLTATPEAAAGLERALALRVELAQRWTELLQTHVAGAATIGELGGIANLEQRSRVHQHILDRHDEALVRRLGRPLPPEAQPASTYAGPPRIVMTAVRTSAAAGEALRLRVRLAAATPTEPPVLHWRWMGEREYKTQPLTPIARSVYDATLPPLDEAHPALEYHLRATVDGTDVRWPVSERGMNQTVILE